MIKNTLITILFISIIGIVTHSEVRISLRKEENQILEQSLVSQDYIIQKLRFNNYLIATHIGKKTFKNDYLIDEKGKKTPYDSIKIFEDKKVFFRYSQIGCNTCIEKSLELSQRYKVPMTIIANYENFNYLNTFKRVNQITNDIYKPYRNIFDFDTLHYPYFFVLNEQNQIIDFNLPMLDDMSITEEFLYRHREIQ